MNNIITAFIIILAGYGVFCLGYKLVTGHFSSPTPEEDPKVTPNMGVLPTEEDLPGVEENETE